MAYNLQPLVQILEQILHPDAYNRPDWLLDPLKTQDIESLLAKARYLKESFENSSSVTHPDVQILEHQTRDAAYQALNIIESHLADQFLSKKDGEKLWISPPNSLQKITEAEFELVFQAMMKIKDNKSGGSLLHSHLVSATKDLNTENILVGMHKDLNELKGRLVGPQLKVEIIPIVGIGGIGKTTLARWLYNDYHFVYYNFEFRAWVTISGSSNMLDILWALLTSLEPDPLMSEYEKEELELMSGYDEELLAREINTRLSGWRYLIVLDDMWSLEVWVRIRECFPDDRNGSRILVTTRDHSMATSVTAGSPHQMTFLNESESWDLLCRKVFARGSCPPELEEIGKKITKYCSGLPHAIHVVGDGLLRLEKTTEAWRQVADDVSLFVAANNDQSTVSILSKSYTFLPNYLKPCFLYMGVFPKQFEIRASELIKLWVAEGFLKPIKSKSFEEAAEEYLGELVQRNLLINYKQEIKGKVKSYVMHDLVSDLCMRKAREEKFLYDEIDIMNELNEKGMHRVRLNMVDVPHDQITRVINDAARARAGISSVLHFPTPSGHFGGELAWLGKTELRLLRVLDVLGVNLQILPEAVKRLFHLRYLAASISSYSRVASSISDLCNLQTLIFQKKQLDGSSVGKIQELFHMSQLRHIKFKGSYPLFALEDGETVARQENLQTLSTVAIDGSFPRILKAIPNLKKLGIQIHDHTSISFYMDLTNLNQLEILKCYGERERSPLPNLILPASLKKLTIDHFVIPRVCLDGISRLRNLEILKLQRCELEDGGEWRPYEGGFRQLRLLLLSLVNLRKWAAENTHFPRLEFLLIQDCYDLEEIPAEIGDISTLDKIEVLGACRKSSAESVRRIQEDQLEYGNDIQVRIRIHSEDLEKDQPLPPQPPVEFMEYSLVRGAANPEISSEKRSVSEITEEISSTIEYVAMDTRTDDLQNSSDSDVMVKISLPGELSMPVDLMVHFMNTSASKDMLNFGLDPKRDEYFFSEAMKPELDSESDLRGGQPSSGPTETCQASVGAVLDSRRMIRGGSKSAETLTPDDWHEAYVVTLTEKVQISLPEKPDCPNLSLLFLQRSIGITEIPENFFDNMPALCFVDLSGTGIKALPQSFYKQTKLQVLMLKDCNRLDNLPSEIRDLNSLEVLNISGTELHCLPDEIGQLSCLRDLQLSLYGPDDERELPHLPRALMSTTVLSELNELQALSIEVHPEDRRWKNIAAEIIEYVAKLNKLTYLRYYFPTVESLECFTRESRSWEKKRLGKFKFIVGDNVNRIVSRVPQEVEAKYNEGKRCLRYVNGNVAAEAVKTALAHASAFYLDHISTIQSLTDFGISNFEEITFCVVRECPDIQYLIATDDRNESAFAKLEHLGIYYLWKLNQIWKDPEHPGNFQRLKHLTVDSCRNLSFIVSQAMVECLSNLEELVVQDCESLEKIIQEKAAGKYGGKVLPQLRKLVLCYLPELVTLGQGLSLSEDQIVTIWHCPKLDLIPQLRKRKQRKEGRSSCTIN